MLRADPISIQIENPKDYEILDQFFRMGIFDEEYGYVLDNVKPVSSRSFYSLHDFPVTKDLKYSEKEFTNILLVREAIPIWNKLCSHQKNFALKAIPLKDPAWIVPGWEVQFINISLLKEVIDKNIDLFRYALGPAITAEMLVNKIAYSEESLINILNQDPVLIGIVLGFGVHNSLVGGRMEMINALSISKDCAPFSSKSLLMQNPSHQNLSCLTPEGFGCYYLEFAGGDDSFFRSNFSPLQPSLSFSNIEEELLALHAMKDPLPVPLLSDNPEFVFSAFKGGPSNQPFFERLQKTQKQTLVLLKKPSFLEQVLEKIGGKKSRIACTICSNVPFSLNSSPIQAKEWASVLKDVANSFEDKEARAAFMEGFCKPSEHSRITPKMIGVSKATFEGLKTALNNLAAADTHFVAYSKDSSLQAIVAKQLYFKTLAAGSGKPLKKADRVRIGYIIENPEGDILFANQDSWLNLSQTIPGFAHGVQEMRIGEKRMLFVHPALGYGALTTLPPCSELIIKVHLLDMDEQSFGILPPLTSLDLSWIQNPDFYRALEESIQQKPRFLGTFYRDLLDKIENLDKNAIIAELE